MLIITQRFARIDSADIDVNLYWFYLTNLPAILIRLPSVTSIFKSISFRISLSLR